MDARTRHRVLQMSGVRVRDFDDLVPLDDDDDELEEQSDELTEALLVAMEEFVELYEPDNARWDPAKHPRNPKGSQGGGRFRSLVARIIDQLDDWKKHGGKDDDPFEGFGRRQLRDAAKKRGIDIPPRASRADIAKLLWGDLQKDLGKGAGPDLDKPDVDKLDVKKPDVDKPDVKKPDGNKPDVDKPDVVDKPDADKPDVDKPDSSGKAKAVHDRLAADKMAEAPPPPIDALMREFADDTPTNLAHLSIRGEPNLYTHHIRDIPRDQMPQLPETAEGLAVFSAELARLGVKADLVKMDPRELVATQSQLDSRKVGNIYKAIRESGWRAGTVMLASREKAILDGHHRWGGASAAVLAGEDFKMDVMWIDMPIDDLLKFADQFSGPKKSMAQQFADRPSGLPTDRKPESGDFEDLAERIFRLKTKAEAYRILQDLNAAELARLASKFPGDPLMVPGWLKTSNRQTGLKIPAGLTLEEKRRWLAEKLKGQGLPAWRSSGGRDD